MTTLGTKVALGRTGLEVSRLGIGSAYGVSPRACLRAFDAGVNYFFWGSVRTAGMGVALRDLTKTHRDELVIVLESYARGGWTLRRSVMNGLKKLGVEYADILLLGWHDAEPPAKILEVAKQLHEEGRFRFLAISSHKRLLFPRFLEMGDFDVFHVLKQCPFPEPHERLTKSARPVLDAVLDRDRDRPEFTIRRFRLDLRAEEPVVGARGGPGR